MPLARSRAGQISAIYGRSEEHTSELQSHVNIVCRLLLEKKKLSDIGIGLPSKIINIHQSQIASKSVSLFTLSGSTWQPWTAREDFDSSSRIFFFFVPATTKIYTLSLHDALPI